MHRQRYRQTGGVLYGPIGPGSWFPVHGPRQDGQEPRARFHVAEWGVFCHTERLRDHPARLKLVLSDSTARRVILTKPSQIILYFQKIDGFFMKIRVTSNLIFFYLFGWRAWKILAEGDKSGTLVCRQG